MAVELLVLAPYTSQWSRLLAYLIEENQVTVTYVLMAVISVSIFLNSSFTLLISFLVLKSSLAIVTLYLSYSTL